LLFLFTGAAEGFWVKLHRFKAYVAPGLPIGFRNSVNHSGAHPLQQIKAAQLSDGEIGSIKVEIACRQG
jgi:hypothetical protein